MAAFDVSIVIVSYNTEELLRKCLDSIMRFTKGVSYEVIVVDNASTDGSVEAVQSSKFKVQNGNSKLKIIQNNKNLGFGRANNQGMKVAKGGYIALLNSDTELFEDSLSKMVSFMDSHTDVGMATCRLLNKDRSIQANGGCKPTLFRLFVWATFIDDVGFLRSILGSYHNQAVNREHEQGWVSGAFMMLRREVLEKVTGFDENFFMYGEDVEFCLRVNKGGWKIFCTPITSIVHLGSGSSSGDIVHFRGGALGKERSILGEFEGLKKIYKKHYPSWQYPLLILILKMAAILRFLIFGIVLSQRGARNIYAKAFIR